MSYEYSDKLDNVARERYKSKLVASGLDICPYKLEAGRWINDPTKWPEVSWPDIYNYLVETPGVYTKTAIKNYRSLEAYNYAVSGWVSTIFYHVTSSGAFLLKADVKPSQQLSDEPHHPWVTTMPDGEILTTHCDCMAGLGESCSHVAALLFKVEAAQRFDKTKSVCTDHPCTWNQCFTRTVEPAPIHRISFFKEASKERLRQKESKGRKRPKVNITSSTPEQKSEFLRELASGTSQSIGLSSFKEHCGPFVPTSVAPEVPDLPINLRSVYSEGNSLNADNMERARANCVNKLQTTAAQRKYLIDNSIDQSNSTTWHEIRVGRITASRVHSVMHTDQSRPAPSVIKNITMPSRNLNHLPAIQWGREHEEEAYEYIEAHRKHLHPKENRTLAT